MERRLDLYQHLDLELENEDVTEWGAAGGCDKMVELVRKVVYLAGKTTQDRRLSDGAKVWINTTI